ncbi:alpha/beta hydrolase [Bradyrhizobium jicamae]|uniref:alpha/beta hydrolase family protein n=1 Tax=Bradyrhizobium jicamae TaxID=280332 RepID=UPI001BA5148D|nr:alpha/beta fold hydrolase [Bradyrhizobium jicamae]MBR0755334.1 alpha/beta hydrolase [Bradyrhizobium jicamae]
MQDQRHIGLDVGKRGSWSTPCDPSAEPLPKIPVLLSPEERAALDALLRAMPQSRLLSSGMAYADVETLRSMATVGVDWVEAACWLAERNLRLAGAAKQKGHRTTALRYFRWASACFRVAQAAIAFDTDLKKELYGRLIAAFSEAAALDDCPTDHWTVDFDEGKLCGWLIRPPLSESSPVVIVLGGFDGWREEHHPAALALVERGIAALLIDVPGQGETRLFHHLYLTSDVHRAFSRIVDALLEDPRVSGRIGILGNSFGGCLVANAAIADQRLAACCVNCGASRPLEFPERYPRFFSKVEAMIGSSCNDQARAVLNALDLTASLGSLRTPLLQLHSEIDTVFSLDNARLIHDQAASDDKTLLVWKDGDHCIYNHADERNTAVADWFCERLGLRD